VFDVDLSKHNREPKIGGGENSLFCPHLLGFVVATPFPNQFLRTSLLNGFKLHGVNPKQV